MKLQLTRTQSQDPVLNRVQDMIELVLAGFQRFPGLSILGRAQSGTGEADAITAATDGHVLRRRGSSIGFGKILASMVTGTSTNDNAAAGDVGEYVVATVAAGGVGSWTTGVTQNVASISLTAGDWDVSGSVFFSNSSATAVTRIASGVTTTSATLPGVDAGRGQLTSAVLSPNGAAVPAGPVRISVSATTTVYLVGTIDFSAGTPGAGGFIRARRVR